MQPLSNLTSDPESRSSTDEPPKERLSVTAIVLISLVAVVVSGALVALIVSMIMSAKKKQKWKK